MWICGQLTFRYAPLPDHKLHILSASGSTPPNDGIHIQVAFILSEGSRRANKSYICVLFFEPLPRPAGQATYESYICVLFFELL